MGSQSYRDLVIWPKGIELSVLVYQAAGSNFPKTELYGLAGRMKRAAVSISSTSEIS